MPSTRECRKKAAPAAQERAGALSGSSGLIARFANETSNLAAGRGQPVATPGPARPAHRIQSVWVGLVTTRQKLDCLPGWARNRRLKYETSEKHTSIAMFWRDEAIPALAAKLAQ